MNRWLAVAVAAVVAAVVTPLAALELTTDAERTYRELRNSTDVKTKLMAERWYSAIKLQEWGDASGKFKTTAKYVEHDPDLTWVKLRTIRGTGDKRVVKDVTVPLEKLSKVCQSRVRQIGVLSEKIAAAIEAEKDKDKKDADGEPRAGELPEDRLSEEDPRGGRGEHDAGLAGMDAEEVVGVGGPPEPRVARESASPQPVAATHNGPPLPVLLPPLPPSSASRESSEPAAGQPVTEATEAPDSAGATEFKHPTTAEELRDRFAQAFGAGDKETLEKLVYWGDSSLEHRRITQSSLLDHAGAAQLHRCNIAVQVDGEPVNGFTLSTTTFLNIEFETRSTVTEIDWPIGEVDGKYYLGAWSREDTEPSRR